MIVGTASAPASAARGTPGPLAGASRPPLQAARLPESAGAPVPEQKSPSLSGGRPLLAPDSVLVLQQSDATGRDAPANSPAEGALRENRGQVRLPNELTKEEQAQVAALKARDREVRAHEGAHRAAGGDLTGPPRFEFETGPDGRQYAVGGEVSIDRSPEPGDPEATIAKLERVIRAALAPAEPSSQDLAVAAQARADLLQARAEAARQSREENTGTG